MVDETQTSEGETKRPVIWTMFCPDLGIYYYRNEQDTSMDPVVLKFTHDELLVHVEGLFEVGKPELAKELVVICAWARSFAHLMVVFFTDGTFQAHKPPPLPDSVYEDVAGMREFVEEWLRKNPDMSKVPVAPAFGKPDGKPDPTPSA
jgi:hypothetical protein